MIELIEHPEGVLLGVRAQPGARENAIRGVQEGALKVAVTQVAEKGKANKAIAQLLCRSLALKRSQIELLSGDTGAQKRFLIRDIALVELAARLRQSAGLLTPGPDRRRHAEQDRGADRSRTAEISPVCLYTSRQILHNNPHIE